MKDFLSNIILLVYLGTVLIHKLLGYTYFTAAWRSALFVAVTILLVIIIVIGYRWVVDNAPEPQSNPESAKAGSGE